MKLKNKLIPLLAVATTASVVAPLVTLASCNNTSFRCFDLAAQKELPAPGASQLSSATKEEATKAYSDYIKRSPDKFQNDYAKFMQRYMLYTIEEAELEGEYELTYDKFDFYVSEPLIRETYVSYPAEPGQTYPTISFAVKFDINRTKEYMYSTNEQQTDKIVEDIQATITYTNVPFYAYSNYSYWTEKYQWYVGCSSIANPYGDYSYILEYMTDPWDIKLDFSFAQTTSYLDMEKKDTNTYKYNLDVDSWYKLYELFEEFSNTNSEQNPVTETLLYLLFDYESEYLSAVNVTNELESRSSVLSVRVNSSTEETKYHPVEIYGLQLSGNQESNVSYTVKEDYKLPIKTYIEGTESEVPEELQNSYLVIESGTELKIGTNNEVIIGSADDTEPTVYIETSSAVALESALTNTFVDYAFPKILYVEDAKGKTTSVSTNVDSNYGIRTWIHADAKLASKTKTWTFADFKTEATTDDGVKLNSVYTGTLSNDNKIYFRTLSEIDPYVTYSWDAETTILDDNNCLWTLKTVNVDETHFNLCLIPAAETITKIDELSQEDDTTVTFENFGNDVLVSLTSTNISDYFNGSAIDHLDLSEIEFTITKQE